MKTEDSHIMNILYSPIMYIHSDQISEFPYERGILNDVILNYWIINQYKLEHLPDHWQPTDAVSILLFSHWSVIPRIAELIGGYIFREKLLIERMSLINDSKLLAFISLPLRHNIRVSQKNQYFDYSLWGEAFIRGLTTNLPLALQQRVSLCFKRSTLSEQPHITSTPDNINLLRMAINYAYDS